MVASSGASPIPKGTLEVARREFLRNTLIIGSSTTLGALGTSRIAAAAPLQSCDILEKLQFATYAAPQADVLFRALDFMCPDPPPQPPEEFVHERWETARQIYMDAIPLVYPYFLVNPPRLGAGGGHNGSSLQVPFTSQFDLSFQPIVGHDEFLAREAELCNLLEGEQDSCLDLVTKIILKILAALGLSFDKDQLQNLLKTLGEELGGLLDDLLNALKAKEYRRAWQLFWALLDQLVGDKVSKALARALGKAAATRFFTALGARLIPWIGWGLFIGALLYEFAKQIF